MVNPIPSRRSGPGSKHQGPHRRWAHLSRVHTICRASRYASEVQGEMAWVLCAFHLVGCLLENSPQALNAAGCRVAQLRARTSFRNPLKPVRLMPGLVGPWGILNGSPQSFECMFELTLGGFAEVSIRKPSSYQSLKSYRFALKTGPNSNNG